MLEDALCGMLGALGTCWDGVCLLPVPMRTGHIYAVWEKGYQYGTMAVYTTSPTAAVRRRSIQQVPEYKMCCGTRLMSGMLVAFGCVKRAYRIMHALCS
jgi:hypothetical protein